MESSHSASYSNHSAGSIDSHEFRSSYRNDLLAFYNREWVQTKFFTPFATLNTGPTPSQDDAVLNALAGVIRVTCADALEAIDEAQNSKSDKEAVIQSSLNTLFQAIEEAAEVHCGTRKYFRRFIPKDTKPLVHESAEVKPDFLLADVHEPDDNGFVTSAPATFDVMRMAHSFIEVKAKAAYSPIPAPANQHRKAVKMTLAQGSDYARLLRATRPLIIHVFGLFFCGNSFSIAHFDHSGIHISPRYFILPGDDTGLRQFIRVVLRMTMEMSPYELGYDPTSFLEPPQTYYQEEYPSFVVTMGTTTRPQTQAQPNAWVTVGEPLFSSHSFLGRGTSVWLAFTFDEPHEPTILKTSWRTSNRDSENTIYEKIKERVGDKPIRGLARVTAGGDVYFKGEPLSVSTVRGSTALLDTTETNRILHRVSLLQVGKPLYDYTSLNELGTALLDALHAHETLCSRNILHRDISIGNVMILVDAQYNDDPTLPPAKRVDVRSRLKGNFGGFLTDFDNAKILDPSDAPSGPGPDGRTGTPLFMASELLWSIHHAQPCLHTVRHDLESFDWVALYAIYKHALKAVPTDHPLYRPLAHEFAWLFTAVSTKGLIKKRAAAFGDENKPVTGASDESKHFRVISPQTVIEDAPAICGGIRALVAYASTVAKSARLNAFLTGVWTDLKVAFEGHQKRARRPPRRLRKDRFMNKMLLHISELKDAPAVARGIGILDADALAHDQSQTDSNSDEGGGPDNTDEDSDVGGTALGVNAHAIPEVYTHERLARKFGVLTCK